MSVGWCKDGWLMIFFGLCGKFENKDRFMLNSLDLFVFDFYLGRKLLVIESDFV